MTAPVIHLERPTLRLDLGCGQNCREGFEGVDLYAPEADQKVDLFKFPWPWETNSVDEIHCSHFLEHLPAREVLSTDLSRQDYSLDLDFLGQDFLFAFFDECWRILKNDGTMTVVVPNARSNRGFQDPTHRRFFVAETFCYLSAQWRSSQKLDHYRVRCDFSGNVNPTIPEELSLLHPEAQARRFNEGWNTIFDWHAVLTCKK